MGNGQESEILLESYPMVGGNGAHSYSKNSSIQRGVMDSAKELINKAIADNLDLKILRFDDTYRTFQIADLGCSIGPNSFLAMQNIIESVELKFQNTISTNWPVEFQVFFNDHKENDFNTLFINLPESRKYFAAGVPGSFHGRLFPKSSLHFVHSCSALHFLSKVPKQVIQSGKLSKEEVAEAFSAQFKNDFESFLNARAEEIVPGGLMVVQISTVADGIPLHQTPVSVHYEIMRSCLMDMAKMGITSEEKVESFRVPIHNPRPKELESIIKRNGSFSIERMEKLNHPMDHITIPVSVYISQIRAINEGFFKKHFGDDFVDTFFNHFTIKVAENHSILEEKRREIIFLFIQIKRNI